MDTTSINAFASWAESNPLPGRHRRGTQTTVEGYLADLRRFARWFEQTTGHPLMAEYLTSDDIQDFLDYLKTVKQYKTTTVLRYFAAIRAYCLFLQATDARVRRDLTAGLRLPRREVLEKRGLRRTERLALERAFNVPQKDTQAARLRLVRDRAIVMVLMYVGLRVAELEALTLDDVTLSERKGTLIVRKGKGTKERTAAVPLKARQALAEWLEVRRSLPVTASNQHVFVQLRRGYRPLGRRAVQQMIAAAGERAGLEIPVTPHVLRHTAVRVWREKTGNDRLTAKQMGHSVATMLRYDSLLSEDDLNRAAAQI